MKNMNKTFAVICAAALLSDPTWAVSKDPLQQFKLASLAYQNGRLDSAEQEFEGFIKYYGDHRLAAQARLALGEIKFSIKKFPEAADLYSLVVKKHGGTYEAMNAELRLGHCEFNMKKYLTAIDHFMAVKNKGPKALRAEALMGWALSLMALNSHEKAEAMLTELLQSYPNYKSNPMAVVPLGLMMLERNRTQDALDMFARLPQDLGASYYRGVALKKQGQIIAASQAFKDVYQDDPTGFWADKAQLQMAEAYYQVNEFNLAYDAYKKVYEKFLTSPLRAYALHRMASIHFNIGRYQEAGLKWEELLRTFEDDVNIANGTYMLGEMALRQGDYGKAMSFFSKISDKNELHMAAQYKIIWVQAQQNQDEAAISRSDKFLKQYTWGELAAQVHLLKGICLQRMKKYGAANSEYQIVMDQFGKSVHAEKALYLMSTSLFQNKQLADIVTSLNANLKSVPVSPSRWQADTYLWIAEAYYALNQYEPAGKTYQLVLDNYKDTPSLASAQLGLAASLAKQGMLDEAAMAHEKAMVMAEDSKNKNVKKSVLMDTAQVLFSQKKYEKAMGHYDEFITKYPDDPLIPLALYQAGISFYRLEYYTEALKRWGRITAEYPKHELAPKAMYEMAKTNFGLGEYQMAGERFQALVDAYPEFEMNKDARIQIAQCFYNQGQFDAAAKRLQEFLDKFPKDPKAKDVSELLQMAHYRTARDKTDLTKLAAKYPKSKLTADIYWQLGAEAYNLKQYKTALEYFRKLVVEFPEAQHVSQAYFFMAESYFNTEDYPNAASAYKNFLGNFPDNPNRPQALLRLGVAYFQAKNYSDAVVAFNDSLEADPNGELSRDSLINIPLCYKRLGQPNEALSAYDRFLQKFPEDAMKNKIILAMGELNEEVKNYEGAIKVYQTIPDSAPESVPSYLAQAKLYHLLNLPNQEISTYEKLRAKRPASDENRLAGLVTLAERYQDLGKVTDSISVYNDIAQNSTNPEWKQAAIERVKTLSITQE